MSIVSHDVLSFSGLVWTTQSIYYAKPFFSTVWRPACGITGQ